MTSDLLDLEYLPGQYVGIFMFLFIRLFRFCIQVHRRVVAPEGRSARRKQRLSDVERHPGVCGSGQQHHSRGAREWVTHISASPRADQVTSLVLIFHNLLMRHFLRNRCYWSDQWGSRWGRPKEDSGGAAATCSQADRRGSVNSSALFRQTPGGAERESSRMSFLVFPLHAL